MRLNDISDAVMSVVEQVEQHRLQSSLISASGFGISLRVADDELEGYRRGQGMRGEGVGGGGAQGFVWIGDDGLAAQGTR